MNLERILQKESEFDSVIEERHLIEGLVLPTLVLPHIGSEDLQTGNYENCAIWTGLHVAAQSLRFASTWDNGARRLAKNSLLALHKLQTVTNDSGIIARGYKLRSEPSWDELFFWIKEGKNLGQSKLRDEEDFPAGNRANAYDALFGYRRNNEWHQEGEYRWLGDASTSQVFGVLYGYFAFHRYCNPTTEEMAFIKKDVANIVHKLLDKKMQIVDTDKKRTTYGGNRRFFGYGVGPAITLSEIKLAHHITGEERFRTEYHRQLEKCMHSGSINPRRPEFGPLKYTHSNLGSDDNLTMLNYSMLMSLEDNNDVLESCRRGLMERWLAINDPQNPLFNFIYHALLGQKSPVLQQGIDALDGFPTTKVVDAVALKRVLPISQQLRDILAPARIPLEERPVDEYAWRINPYRHDKWVPVLPGKMEFTGIDFLFAKNFALYHNLLS